MLNYLRCLRKYHEKVKPKLKRRKNVGIYYVFPTKTQEVLCVGRAHQPSGSTQFETVLSANLALLGKNGPLRVFVNLLNSNTKEPHLCRKHW